MRQGLLRKERNLLKNSIDWDRFSYGKEGWIKTRAYLNAHDLTTYVGMIEGRDERTDKPIYDIKFHFPTIEAAWEWAEGRVDYPYAVLKG